MSDYPHLLSPLRIGSVTVRNRVVQTAHVKMFSERGIDTERNRAYQEARARGGVGLIIDGNRLVHPSSNGLNPRLLSWAHARKGIPATRAMTDVVHEHGARIFAQLNHYGAQGTSEAADDLRFTVAPSQLRAPATGEPAKAMEVEEIREVTRWWGRSAAIAREAGFDGVEVHIAHSYLLHEFLSAAYNRRADEYGGSFENRLRFPREVVEEVRRQVGDDFVVGIRLVVHEFFDDERGLTVDDAIRAAQALHAAARLDFVNVSGAGHHNIYMAMGTADIPGGWLVEHVAKLKRAMPPELPVFVVGGIGDADEAERLIAEGKADMVAMTRAQIADPDLVAKVRAGRKADVYRCVRLNQGCIAHTNLGTPIGCTVNPATGREALFAPDRIKPAESPGNWVVVGGGPAGMKAAETLARRGHKVTLLEREEELGGQSRLAAMNPGRETLRWIAEDLEHHMRAHGVEIKLGVEADVEAVRALAPDGVIVATGAKPDYSGRSMVAPFAEGIEGVGPETALSTWDVLLERRPVGRRVVVLDDVGTRYAAGPTEVLLDRGHEVELISRWHALFPATLLTMDMAPLYKRLFSKGLRYRLNTWARRWDGRSLTAYCLHSGAETVIDRVDTLVLATGPRADEDLYFALRDAGIPSVHRVGDCVAPRKLDHAIYEGFLAGLERFGTEQRYIDDDELYEPAVGAAAAGKGQ